MSERSTQQVLIDRYTGVFKLNMKEAQDIMQKAFNNAETMDMQNSDGYTIAEEIAMRLVNLQRQLNCMATDLCIDILGYTKRVREEFE